MMISNKIFILLKLNIYGYFFINVIVEICDIKRKDGFFYLMFLILLWVNIYKFKMKVWMWISYKKSLNVFIFNREYYILFLIID